MDDELKNTENSVESDAESAKQQNNSVLKRKSRNKRS